MVLLYFIVGMISRLLEKCKCHLRFSMKNASATCGFQLAVNSSSLPRAECRQVDKLRERGGNAWNIAIVRENANEVIDISLLTAK